MRESQMKRFLETSSRKIAEMGFTRCVVADLPLEARNMCATRCGGGSGFRLKPKIGRDPRCHSQNPAIPCRHRDTRRIYVRNPRLARWCQERNSKWIAQEFPISYSESVRNCFGFRFGVHVGELLNDELHAANLFVPLHRPDFSRISRWHIAVSFLVGLI